MIDDSDDGILEAIREPVALVAADPRWMDAFAEERRRLVAALPDRFIEVEHFGSTAVPCLDAKPVIDILGGLRTLQEADSLIAPLRRLGYHFPLEFNASLSEHRWLMRQHRGHRTHHMHLLVHNGTRWKRELAFRDLLRSNAEVAAQYLRLKMHLAADHANDRERYTSAKAEFIAAALGAF